MVCRIYSDIVTYMEDVESSWKLLARSPDYPHITKVPIYLLPVRLPSVLLRKRNRQSSRHGPVLGFGAKANGSVGLQNCIPVKLSRYSESQWVIRHCLATWFSSWDGRLASHQGPARTLQECLFKVWLGTGVAKLQWPSCKSGSKCLMKSSPESPWLLGVEYVVFLQYPRCHPGPGGTFLWSFCLASCCCDMLDCQSASWSSPFALTSTGFAGEGFRGEEV